MKPVGRDSSGSVMPHSTPKEAMAAEASAPPATSRAGMSTALAEPNSVPSREVAPTGTAMANNCRWVICARALAGGYRRQ